jgi:hypothetical protein
LKCSKAKNARCGWGRIAEDLSFSDHKETFPLNYSARRMLEQATANPKAFSLKNPLPAKKDLTDIGCRE